MRTARIRFALIETLADAWADSRVRLAASLLWRTSLAGVADPTSDAGQVQASSREP